MFLKSESANKVNANPFKKKTNLTSNQDIF